MPGSQPPPHVQPPPHQAPMPAPHVNPAFFPPASQAPATSMPIHV